MRHRERIESGCMHCSGFHDLHTHTHKKNTDLPHTTAMCFSFSLSVRWNYLLVTTHSELGKLKATQCRSNKCHQNGIVSYIFFFCETKNASHMKAALQRDARLNRNTNSGICHDKHFHARYQRVFVLYLFLSHLL